MRLKRAQLASAGTTSQLKTAYRTWRHTEGAELTLGMPTSKKMVDVTRYKWMRFSCIIMHQM